MFKVILWLLLLPPVYAAPAHHSNATGSSACLAVVLVVLSILSLLLICKRIFLTTRKSKPLETSNISARSFASILPSSDYSHTRKAAFFVGFFGSPAWETKATNLFDKTRSTDSKLHLSFSSYQYFGSRHSRSSRIPFYEHLDGNASMVRAIPRPFSMPAAGDSDFHTSRVTQETVHSDSQKIWFSPRNLARPSPSITTIRRFSMPSVRPSDASSLERLNRASLVKILTNRRFDSRISSLVESPSLKLVQTITGNNQEHPLPLSPTPSQADDATSHIIPTYSGVPPEYTDERKKKNRISRPYALTPSSAFNCPSLSGVDKQVPTPILNSFSPVLLPVNLSPLSVPLPAVYNKDIAPETISRSPLVKSIVSPNLKQRERRKPSIRIRRSPAIGPSPLRAMILADPSDSKIAVKISQMGSRHSNTSLDYSCLGLGFPKSPSSTRDNNYEAESSSDGEYLQLENDSKALSATLDTKDPNTLVGMIRELVEETNQWDRSLFKDRNFKAMIDGSKHALNGTQNHGCVVAEELSPRDDGIAWEDKSCEVDLSLLGLDIFRSGGETFIPCAEKKEHLVGDDIKPHMVSWEDNLTNWPVEQSKDETVGLAC